MEVQSAILWNFSPDQAWLYHNRTRTCTMRHYAYWSITCLWQTTAFYACSSSTCYEGHSNWSVFIK